MSSQHATQRAHVTTTISGRLMNHVRFLLDLALQGSLTGNYARYRVNVYSHHGLSTFIVAVAAVEAFVNETFLADHSWRLLQGTRLGSEDREQVQWWEIREKLVRIPELAFGRTFDRGVNPFQDMSTFVDLRNDLTHYKMSASIPKHMERLARRRIALRACLRIG